MLKSIIGTFACTWLLTALTCTAQSPPVLDASGQPVEAGANYYILPATTGVAGGLTLLSRGEPCPQFVGQEPLAPTVSNGLPITLIPRASGQSNIVREETAYSFVFRSGTKCGKNETAWELVDDDDDQPQGSNRTITIKIKAGEVPQQNKPEWEYQDRYFKIVKNKQSGLYNLELCPGCQAENCQLPLCAPLGISVEDGQRLLVVYGPAFPFIFRRA